MCPVNVLRSVLALITGCSAALIAYSAFFVRGDAGGVMKYLYARAALRHLRESGADAAQLTAAQAGLQQLGQHVADPVLAAKLIPLAVLLGVVVAVLVWRLFHRHEGQDARPDVQERMVYRLAHRKGGKFTLRDLTDSSPLDEEQARKVTRRMLDVGRLQREGEEYRLT